MQMDDMYPSKWLRAADLGTKTAKVTIASIDIEHFQDGSSKPTLSFVGKEKGMVLNKTNATAIAGSFGNNTDGWMGKEIEIFSMKVQGPSGLVDGIRIRIPDASRAAVAASEPVGVGATTDADLNDDIPF